MKILSESINFSVAPLDCLWYGGVTKCSILFNVQKVLNSLDKKHWPLSETNILGRSTYLKVERSA